jgi:hypothetical protein
MPYKRKRQEDSGAAARTQKPKRLFTERDRDRASLFDQLADEKHETRIQAAKKLLEEFAPANNPDAETLKDFLRRLIKGLSSGRKAARAGYFVTLSELLRQCSTSVDLYTEAIGGTQELLSMINGLTKPDRNFPDVSICGNIS